MGVDLGDVGRHVGTGNDVIIYIWQAYVLTPSLVFV